MYSKHHTGNIVFNLHLRIDNDDKVNISYDLLLSPQLHREYNYAERKLQHKINKKNKTGNWEEEKGKKKKSENGRKYR